MKKKNEQESIPAFLFMRNFYEALKAMPDAEQVRASLFALCELAYNGKEPAKNLGAFPTMFVAMCRPAVEKSISRYRAAARNGAKGGAPKGNRNARKGKAAADSTSDPDTEDNTPPVAHAAPASVEEVQAYCEANGIDIDAERFCDYWEAVGWTWRNPLVKTWQDAARQWKNPDDF